MPLLTYEDCDGHAHIEAELLFEPNVRRAYDMAGRPFHYAEPKLIAALLSGAGGTKPVALDRDTALGFYGDEEVAFREGLEAARLNEDPDLLAATYERADERRDEREAA